MTTGTPFETQPSAAPQDEGYAMEATHIRAKACDKPDVRGYNSQAGNWKLDAAGR